jgi:hypothetical protein
VTGRQFKVILYIHEYEGKQKKAMRLRKEVQEYPNKPLEVALIDKLKDNHNKKTLSIGV